MRPGRSVWVFVQVAGGQQQQQTRGLLSPAFAVIHPVASSMSGSTHRATAQIGSRTRPRYSLPAIDERPARLHSADPAMDDTIRSLRDFADTILELKRSGGGAADIRAACTAGSVLLLKAREQSRLAALEAERRREATSQQRSNLDHESQELLNLVYEQQHYDREIASYRTFASAVSEQQLCAISAAEFAALPEAAAAAGPHARELARLQHELAARETLKTTLQRLAADKAAAAAALSSAAARIDDLRTHFEGLSASNRPLLEAAAPAAAAAKAHREAAELLPLPLYVVYSQAASGGRLLGLPLAASVDGNTTAAVRLAAQQQAAAAAGGQQALAAAAAADATSAQQQRAKRRRKSDAAEDATYQEHPLFVVLELSGPGGAPLAVLRFSYYSSLQLVGVSAGSAEGEEVLTDLFLGDTGDGAGLDACVAAAGSSGAPPTFPAGSRPRPFKWAQDLAGLDVLPALPAALSGAERRDALAVLSAARGQLRLEALLERLSAAVTGRRALNDILAKLSSKPGHLHCSLEAGLAAKPATFISSWKHVADGTHTTQLGRAGQPLQLAAAAPAAGWAAAAAPGGSLAEEGELDGGADGADVSSALALLQHVDTAEEDLLQGLLLDEAGGRSDDMLHDRPAAGDGGAAPNGRDDGEQPAAASGGSDGAAAGGGSGGDGESSGPGGGSDAAAGVAARYVVYRLVLRLSPVLEVHATAKVFLAYPALPPVFSVTKLLDTSTRSSKSVAITSANDTLRLERQANALAVQAARSCPNKVLAVQLLQLRQCVDALFGQLRSAGTARDPIERLRAKQQLRGRERQARLPLNSDC